MVHPYGMELKTSVAANDRNKKDKNQNPHFWPISLTVNGVSDDSKMALFFSDSQWDNGTFKKKWLSNLADFSALYPGSTEKRLTQSCKCRSYFSPCGVHIKESALTSLLKKELNTKVHVFILKSIKPH